MTGLEILAKCWKRGIKIYPVPQDKSRDPLCVIEVNYKGVKTQGKEKYKQGPKLWKRIWEGYEYYVQKENL